MRERPPDALLPEFSTEDEDQVGGPAAPGRMARGRPGINPGQQCQQRLCMLGSTTGSSSPPALPALTLAAASCLPIPSGAQSAEGLCEEPF